MGVHDHFHVDASMIGVLWAFVKHCDSVVISMNLISYNCSCIHVVFYMNYISIDLTSTEIMRPL